MYWRQGGTNVSFLFIYLYISLILPGVDAESLFRTNTRDEKKSRLIETVVSVSFFVSSMCVLYK